MKKEINNLKLVENNNETIKCMNTKCNLKKYEELYKETQETFKMLMDNTQKLLKNKDITSSDKEKIKKEIVRIKQLLKNMSVPSHKKTEINRMRDACIKKYCNKKCLGTIFEDGDANKLPKELKNKYNNKIALESRKEIFGKKTSVLKDNFYEKLEASKVKKLKKEGCVSGCIR